VLSNRHVQRLLTAGPIGLVTDGIRFKTHHNWSIIVYQKKVPSTFLRGEYLINLLFKESQSSE